MLRRHEIYQMSFEDERSKCMKLEAKMKIEEADTQNWTESRNQSESLSDQEKNIDKQLSMSKPLVTEIMEFLYNKQRETSNE